jgi:hypothetical protein
VITKFPAEELLVAGRKYWTAGGSLHTVRDSQSHLNTPAGRGETRVAAAVAGAAGRDQARVPVSADAAGEGQARVPASAPGAVGLGD